MDQSYTNNLIARPPETDALSRKADTLMPYSRLELRPYQLFVKYNIHPFSTQKRFLLKLGTGLGKTLCALLATKNFVDRDQTVTLITFTQHTFTDHINSYTELGLYLKHNQAKIQKYGYIELINNLFTEDTQNKNIIINKTLLHSFYNGLIVFDEIQNSYNKQSNNIQAKVILLISKILQNKTTMLFLSATPLLYSEEIEDLLQLLSFKPEYDDRDSFERINTVAQELQVKHSQSSISDFIMDCISDVPRITPTDENIKDICRGKICFIPESIGGDMPTLKFQGHPYVSIPNLTLDVCIAPQHFSAQQLLELNKSVKSSAHSVADIREKRQSDPKNVAFESMKHIQFTYQDGDLKSLSESHKEARSLESFIYLYEKGDENILNWAKQNGVLYANKQLSGPFLQLKNIGKYSPKYARALEIILTASGKSFIYFNRIKTYGTDLICAMLKENGIIEHGQMPTANTLCFKCKHTFSNHQGSIADKHVFTPYQFFRITGVEGNSYYAAQQIFNSERNTYGDYIQIIVGSIKVVEGYTFKAVSNVLILSLPYNAANFIQVIGRAVRNQSHAALPHDKRIVNTHVLVNGFKDTKDAAIETLIREDLNNITKEEFDYFIKFRDFQRVKQYEKVIHSVAMDVPVYGKVYFNVKDDVYKLDNALKLDPFQLDASLKPFQPRALQTTQQMFEFNLDNYYLAGANRDVINNIKTVIMSRFEMSPVWRIDLLMQSIRSAYVFPSLQNLADSDIKLHIFNRRNVHVVGDYVCFLKSTDSKQSIYIGTERSQPPDIDFFLPRSKLRIVAFSPNAEDSEVSKLLSQLAQLVAFKLPLVFISIMEGRRIQPLDEAYIQAAMSLSSEVRTLVSAIFNAYLPKSIQDLVPEQFQFASSGYFPYCDKHMIPIIIKNKQDKTITQKSLRQNNKCQLCTQYVSMLSKLLESKECQKLIYTFFTHTAIKNREVYAMAESDPIADNVLGFMNQQHTLLRIMQDGRQIPVSFQSSIFLNYIFISHNKIKISIDGHRKICDKITNEQLEVLMANASLPSQKFESRKHFCFVLLQHMWNQEFASRLKFIPDKTIIWKE